MLNDWKYKYKESKDNCPNPITKCKFWEDEETMVASCKCVNDCNNFIGINEKKKYVLCSLVYLDKMS